MDESNGLCISYIISYHMRLSDRLVSPVGSCHMVCRMYSKYPRYIISPSFPGLFTCHGSDGFSREPPSPRFSIII